MLKFFAIAVICIVLLNNDLKPETYHEYFEVKLLGSKILRVLNSIQAVILDWWSGQLEANQNVQIRTEVPLVLLQTKYSQGSSAYRTVYQNYISAGINDIQGGRKLLQ